MGNFLSFPNRASIKLGSLRRILQDLKYTPFLMNFSFLKDFNMVLCYKDKLGGRNFDNYTQQNVEATLEKVVDRSGRQVTVTIRHIMLDACSNFRRLLCFYLSATR